MAYYDLEPFGEHIADIRHGIATSVLANINRDSKARPEPYRWDDFVFWKEGQGAETSEPVLLDDPVAQSNLLRAAVFGKTSTK